MIQIFRGNNEGLAACQTGAWDQAKMLFVPFNRHEFLVGGGDEAKYDLNFAYYFLNKSEGVEILLADC